MQGQGKTPAQPGGGAEGGSMTSTRERQRPSAAPSSLIIRPQPAEFLGHGPAHSPACTPDRCPTRRDHFLSTTLSLAELPSALTHKGPWYQSALPAPQTTHLPSRVFPAFPTRGRPAPDRPAQQQACFFLPEGEANPCLCSQQATPWVPCSSFTCPL